MRSPNFHRRIGVVTATVALLAGALAAPAAAAPKNDLQASKSTKLAEKLVKNVTVTGANRHLIALQRIADRNGGNRAADTSGYDASVDYVVGQLRNAGFIVTTPAFTYEEEVADAERITVGGVDYHIEKMAESIQTPVGGITGTLRVVPQDATTGCEPEDFSTADYTGTVALIRRGGCTFEIKSNNAAAAGAVAVAISNNVAGPLSNVTITNEGPVPVGGVSKEDGDVLAGLGGQSATVEMVYHIEEIVQRNVIAETRTGRANNVVMLGAHLDSVEVGAGINDNGTGSAGLLELALKLGSSPKVNNAVRFGWWGAEELGLIGSTEYVRSLTYEQQLDIALYLNFDMIGSPNAGYFVYDGDDSDGVGAGAGPYGSAQIEETFTDFFDERLGVPTQGTDFSGRSDYGEFIAQGIPAGGLFTGAEGLKTAEQAALWGGQVGVAYDPCYHAACDNLGNVDRQAYDLNLDAAAWAAGVYAYSTEGVNGVPPRAKRADMRMNANRAGLAAVVDSDRTAA